MYTLTKVCDHNTPLKKNHVHCFGENETIILNVFILWVIVRVYVRKYHLIIRRYEEEKKIFLI